MRRRLAMGLRARSFAVDEARGLIPLAVPPERVVVDIAHARAPGAVLMPIVRDIAARWPRAPLLVLAPSPSASLMYMALRLGAVHCITRTHDAGVILEAFAEAERPPDINAPLDAFATLEEARWQHIGRALESARGNISVAARLLGLHRQSLQRMLRGLRRDAEAHAGDDGGDGEEVAERAAGG